MLVARPCAAEIKTFKDDNQRFSTHIIKLNDIFQAKIRFFGETERPFIKVADDDYDYIYSPRFSLFITLETINPTESYQRIPDIDFRDHSFAFFVPGMPKPEVATFSDVKNSSYNSIPGTETLYVQQHSDGSYSGRVRSKHYYTFAEVDLIYFRSKAPAHVNIISFADNLVYAMKNKLSMELLIPYFDTFPQTDDKAKAFIIKLTPEILAEWQAVTGFDERVWKYIKPSAVGVEGNMLKTYKTK